MDQPETPDTNAAETGPPIDPFGSDTQNSEVGRSPLTALQSVFLWLSFWPTFVLLVGLFPVLLHALDITQDSWNIFAGIVAYATGFPVARALFRFFRSGRFRAGLLVGAFGWFYGPLYGIAAVVLLLAGANCSELDLENLAEAPKESPRRQLSQEPVRSSRALPVAYEAGDPFMECVDELYQRHDADSRIDSTIRSMLNGSLTVSSAQVVVYDTIVEVCLAHAKNPKYDLGPYFGAALRNRRNSTFNERTRFDSCTIAFDEHDLRAPSDSVEEVIHLRQALCQLERENAEAALALQLKARGFSNGEIAARLGCSKSLAGNKISEARDRLAELLGFERGRLR